MITLIKFNQIKSPIPIQFQESSLVVPFVYHDNPILTPITRLVVRIPLDKELAAKPIKLSWFTRTISGELIPVAMVVLDLG